MSDKKECLIWRTPADHSPSNDPFKPLFISPRTGGDYIASVRLQFELETLDERGKARLTSWLVEQRLLGLETPEVTSDNVGEAKQRQPLSVPGRADRLLQYVRNKSQNIGSPVDYKNNVYSDPACMTMLAWSESTAIEELHFLLRYLEQRGWLDNPGISKDGGSVRVLVDGYIHLAEIEEELVDSSQAFVAMWFDATMRDAYEQGIKPAILETGYRSLRIDRVEHIKKIDDEIITGIRRSRFVIADFTHGDSGARGGVYYEAGFAHGLNIPVIFTCKQDRFDKVHFDTRQFNHIVWETPDELREKLAIRISAVIGDGPQIANSRVRR